MLRVQLGEISEAVRSVVPQSMWAAFVKKLAQLEQHSEALDVGAEGRTSLPDLMTDRYPADPRLRFTVAALLLNLSWRPESAGYRL